MARPADLTWQSSSECVVLSAFAGGRIVSWQRDGRELAMAPLIGEGGMFRVLLAEEQYPGASYASPHRVLDWQSSATGFTAKLRHYWSLPNWFMRRADWPERANELHLDGLVLDKTLTYDVSRSTLLCDLTITNVTDHVKYITPWVHSAFDPWPAEHFVAIGGENKGYEDTDIYWGSHLAEPGRPMRMVLADKEGALFAVFGAAADCLKSMCGMMPVPGEFHQATAELRCLTIELGAGERWHANCFLAFTGNWMRWATDAPEELFSQVEPAGELDGDAVSPSLLEQWLLPEEEASGLMVLSFLDKAPFFSGGRYHANQCFAGFHAEGDRAEAHVMLYAAKEMHAAAELCAPDGWSVRPVSMDLKQHDFQPLTLVGPRDLRGKEAVSVTILAGDHRVALHIPPETGVEPRYAYQVRQGPIYMERRYREKTGPAPDATADEVRAWQDRTRKRFRQYLECNATGPCCPEPRLVERQMGPTCVREKWLIQTEPGIWVPGFLIRPKAVDGPMPLLYFLHGSGPGKDLYAPDEVANPPRTQLGHEIEFMPYVVATGLKCLVYVPDGRGQGEMGETNTAQWPARLESLGVRNDMLRLLDQIRGLDWFVTRPEVDASRVGSVGCSGGGGLTYLFAAADERVIASLVMSTSAGAPLRPLVPGYFHRMFADRSMTVDGHGSVPISGAPMGMLIAPRPMWIIDGLDDLGIPAEQRPEWRKTMQIGRDQIRRVYETLGAGEKYRDCWLAGGHCAGFTGKNVVEYFAQWFGR